MPDRRITGPSLAIAAAFAALLLFVAAPTPAAAQSAGEIFSPAELSTIPKVASPARAKSLIERSYPASLRGSTISGRVDLQFIVGPDGKVEPNSVQVMASTHTAFVDAAVEVVQKLEFNPGIKEGKPVRTRVILPIAYAGN